MKDPAPDGDIATVWSALRRRKMVQWGFAYAAGAWVLLQVIEYFSGTFDWPRQIQQYATVALIVGLPIAIVLAWYHADRGEQRVSRTELAIITLLFLVGGGILWRYDRAHETAVEGSSATALPAAPSAAAAPDPKSIAVLPFVNMSSDKEQEYFTDGISEELLNLLAKIPELRVIGRTSSFQFKGRNEDLRVIGEKLNVAHILEGSVRKSGEKVRITAQLIKAADGSHLWSETYDRTLDDIFVVQDEIAAAVVSELKIKLLGAVPKAKTTDPKAYALFLQAREIGRQFSAAAYEKSIALYQQALALDPAYAAAWEGLAGNYCEQIDAGLRFANDSIGLAREATQKALALDPDYAPAHARLGWIAIYYDADLAAAAGHLEYALMLEPVNPDIIGTAAVLARRLGRQEQAIALGAFQVSRDPLNSDGHYDLGLAYRYDGRLDEAIAEFRTVLSLAPGNIGAHEIIGEVLLQQGNAKAALSEIEQESDEQWRLNGLALAYQALGQRAESDAALADLIKKYERTFAGNIAYVLAFRGEADRAFEWLDKAIRYHDPGLTSIATYPMWANIHSDPRWLPLLHELGQAPEQLAEIKFDVKVPK